MRTRLLAALLFFPLLSLAQAFSLLEPSAGHNALAGAGSALLLDETTVRYSPGGMSFVQGAHMSVNLGIRRSAWIFKGENESSLWRASGLQVPVNLFGIWDTPVKQLKMGLAAYSGYGQRSRWDEHWPGRYILQERDLQVYAIQPVLSYQLSEALGLGAGPVFSRAALRQEQALGADFASEMPGKISFNGTGLGLGWTAGLYYRLPGMLALSVSYQSSVVHVVDKGSARMLIPEGVLSLSAAKEGFSTRIRVPSRTSLALSVPVNEEFSVAVDASYLHWRGVEGQSLLLEKEGQPYLRSQEYTQRFSAAGALRIGLTHKTSSRLELRAGTAYLLSPAHGKSFSAIYPDANRFILSAGAGYNLKKHWKLNASLALENMEAPSGKDRNNGLSGTFKSNVYSPGLALSYAW